jgi:hypothetical protein
MRFLCRITGVLLPLVAHAASQTWTLANSQISRTVTFTSAQGLFTERLSDVATHADFILPGKLRLSMAPEFSFECNGRTYKGTSEDRALTKKRLRTENHLQSGCTADKFPSKWL